MSLWTHIADGGVLAYTLNLLLHLTLICLVVLCVSRLFFRRDPAMRHSLCLTGLVCLLLAPIVVGIEAKTGFGLVTFALPSAAAEPKTVISSLALAPAEKPYRVAISAEVPTRPSIGWAWEGWGLFALYLLGFSWGTLRFAHGCRRASRLKQHVSPWKGSTESVTLRTIEQVLRAPAPPVFTSPYVASPIAIGILRPAVILPEGLSETLSPQQLRHVLLHECAHVAFRHGLGGLLERIVGVLFWPHPLVRALCRELARAREEVCDNFASQEDGATCYARTLLMIAQGIDTAPHLASTLALLGTGTSLEARIAGLLDPRRNRMVSLKRWKLWTVTGTAVIAVASTGAVRVVAAQEGSGQAGGLPGNSIVTRVFAFQFVDANEAAELLSASLSPEQLQQIRMVVDSRTNTMLVQCPGDQMAAVATAFGSLEAQAKEARAQQEPVPAPAPPAVEAPVVKQPIVTVTPQAAPLIRVSPSPQPTQTAVQTASVRVPKKTVQSVKSRAAAAQSPSAKATASTTKGKVLTYTTVVPGAKFTTSTLFQYKTAQPAPKTSHIDAKFTVTKTGNTKSTTVTTFPTWMVKPTKTTNVMTWKVMIKPNSGSTTQRSVTDRYTTSAIELFTTGDKANNVKVEVKSLPLQSGKSGSAPTGTLALKATPSAQTGKVFITTDDKVSFGDRLKQDTRVLLQSSTVDRIGIDSKDALLNKVVRDDMLAGRAAVTGNQVIVLDKTERLNDLAKILSDQLSKQSLQITQEQKVILLKSADANLLAAKLKAEAENKMKYEKALQDAEEARYRKAYEQNKKQGANP